MGWTMGFEPTTTGITIRYSNQLSYAHHKASFASTFRGVLSSRHPASSAPLARDAITRAVHGAPFRAGFAVRRVFQTRGVKASRRRSRCDQLSYAHHKSY